MDKDIILVNTEDEPVGYGSKEEVHRKGLLHRAFSVFLYHGDKLLIQQRAEGKYHSAGLWANTCCSHPRQGETLEAAVKRRLLEEAGIVCETKEIFSFVYRHVFHENLYEHEFDHVFLGAFQGDCRMNPEEVQAFRWIGLEELEEELRERPENYASWFKIAAPEVIRYLKNNLLRFCEK